MPTTLGFIGAGHVVQNRYLDVTVEREDIVVAGFCSKSGKRSKLLAEEVPGAEYYSSHETMLSDDSIDGVFVCVPNDLHKSLTLQSLEAGKHVFLEKPVSGTFETSRELIQEAKKHEPVLCLSANNNFRRENEWFVNSVKQGRCGEVDLISLQWIRPTKGTGKSWLYSQSRSGGGVLMDLGYHLLRLALDAIPDRTSFRLSGNQIFHRDGEDRVEDTFIGWVELDDSTIIDLTLAWDEPSSTGTRVRIEAYGDKMSLSPDDAPPSPGNKGFPEMIDQFLNSINTSTQPDLSDALDTMQLIDRFYCSASEQRVVEDTFTSEEWDH